MSKDAMKRAADKRANRNVMNRRKKARARGLVHEANRQHNLRKSGDATVRAFAAAMAHTNAAPSITATAEDLNPEGVVLDLPNYSSMTVADLKAECKAHGLKGYSKLKKDALVALLEGE